MEYTLGLDESTREGVQRILRGQLEQSLLELEMSGEPVDARIHSVRKRMKKLRGLLRLIEGRLDPHDFERENDCFRSAAHQLASARRAAALLASFDALFERFPDGLEPQARNVFRRRLVEERDRAIEDVHGERHSEAITGLRASLERVTRWQLEAEGWKLIGSGFEKTYARGRRAFRRAQAEPNTEVLHSWRRFAKYHWYHLRLLERVWPEMLKASIEAVDELGDLLGSEHDLDDLRQLLISGPTDEQWLEPLSTLLGLMEQRRKELTREAFTLGERVYAERPRPAARRMRAYFESVTRGAE
jgi:CHAD domain-containing protein